MKKKILMLIILFSLFMMVQANEFELLKNNNGEDVISFELSDISTEELIINGEVCNKIIVEDLPLLNDKGKPALPFKTFSYALDYNCDYKIEIDMILTTEKKVKKILPAKGKIYRNVDPTTVPYTFDYSVYLNNKYYPSNVVEISDTYFIRKQKGSSIKVHPIQYNPITGIAKIIKKIEFRIVPVNKTSKRNTVNENSDIYNKIYSNYFINHSQLKRYNSIDETENMIIITASKYKSAAEKLAFWKNRSGIKTKVYEYPTDFNGSGYQAVQSLIQDKYDNDNISFILIIGDHSDVPSPPYTQQSYNLTTASDPVYTYLSGNDKKPDAFVGRFSVETEEQAMTVVNKNLNYECNPKDMGTNDTKWFTSCMGIASNEGTPTDQQWLNGFKDTLFSYNYKTYDSAYDPSASASEMSNAINNGKGWINYMGHGDFDLWVTGNFGTSHVNSLANTGKLPIIISVACVNGEFKDRTCFAEAWQRLGSQDESKGSIIFLGASVYQAWTPPQTANQEMMHLLKKETYSTIGAIINNGQLKMLEQDNDQETMDTWHTFGDPSLKMITDVPSELTVSHSENIGMGQQNIDVSVSGADDAKVCLYSKKQDIQVIRGGTRASIPVNITTSDTIYITVTARNRIPYQGFIIPGSTPVTSSNNIKNSSMKMNVKKNQINVFTIDNSISKVSIFSTNGRLIKEYKVSGKGKWHNIKMPKAAGVHIVSIKSNNKTVMNRVVNFTK